ncbi:hypothetical protein E2C01_083739 [Portunus trituberculatus]|uniref:Uncharacterized protein n=1 Tax=Portunus trituberculatus TaxID=210409 RepID=A0A5B7J7C5_PORTR|nr:hypothetical protein [Portunus trituberculatus]
MYHLLPMTPLADLSTPPNPSPPLLPVRSLFLPRDAPGGVAPEVFGQESVVHVCFVLPRVSQWLAGPCKQHGVLFKGACEG